MKVYCWLAKWTDTAQRVHHVTYSGAWRGAAVKRHTRPGHVTHALPLERCEPTWNDVAGNPPPEKTDLRARIFHRLGIIVFYLCFFLVLSWLLSLTYKELLSRHRQLHTAEPGIQCTVFTDSLEALREITEAKRIRTLNHKVKNDYSSLGNYHRIDARVDRVPGHTGSVGNEAAHRATRAHLELICSYSGSSVPSHVAPDGGLDSQDKKTTDKVPDQT